MAIDLQEYEGRIVAYASKFRYYYDMDDLIQVGRIGLLNALDHYDPTQNTKFSSYAFLYIKGEILKYVRENKNIKISKELSSLVKPIERAREILRQRLQKEPTIDEVSHFLEINRSVIEEVMLDEPQYWKKYYRTGFNDSLLDIRYSLSDRIRYYWPHSRIKNSVETMMVNLEGVDIPLGMISQYLPKQFERIQSGELSAIPHQLIMDKIYDVLRAYRYGCAE